MAKKLPAFQFYTGDWLKDPKLSMCSPATRGIWIDLLCAMHETDRMGVIAGKREQLARACRCSTVELDSAIEELRLTNTADVTERNGVVTVLCRRMNREYKEREGANLRQTRKRKRQICHADVTDEVTLHSSSSVSTSSSNKKENTKETPGSLGASPGLFQSPCEGSLGEYDWITIEYEFLTKWNSTKGVIPLPKSALPQNLSRPFQQLWCDPQWRETAMQALAKFPLKNGAKIALRRFLEADYVYNIVGGVHDFEPGRKEDPTRIRPDEESQFTRLLREKRASQS